jgi:lipopolysaccharide heptosyltransferase II
MTEAFHQLAFRHQVRRQILRQVPKFPIQQLKPPATERILVIRPDHLGDVLLTTPAIHALRRAKPNAEIHALVGSWSADVLADYPELDRVLTLQFPGFTRAAKRSWRFPYQLLLKSARELHLVGYHSAVIFRHDHWWGAMMAFFAGIPQRIGYDLPDVAPFLTHALPHQHQHAVRQSLRLVENWTGELSDEQVVYRFPVNELDSSYVDGYLDEWGIASDDSVLAIHPGSGTWVKRWDGANWATIADTLAGQLDARVVFTGGDHELPLVREIVERMQSPVCLMVGDTAIGQLAALYARSRLVLGPDSGPLHLAAAVGTPTVALFGPADPVEFRQWGASERHMVLTSDLGCRPCRVLDWGSDAPENHPCVREIKIGQVLEAAHRVTQSDLA